MLFRYTVSTALSGLKSNKTRSGLTILGIVIGITSIMLIMSIGQGAESLILNEIGGLGAETIVIRPGQEPRGPSDFADTLFSDSLKSRDLNALRKKKQCSGFGFFDARRHRARERFVRRRDIPTADIWRVS